MIEIHIGLCLHWKWSIGWWKGMGYGWADVGPLHLALLIDGGHTP